MQKVVTDKAEIIRLLRLNSKIIESFGAKRIGIFGSFIKNQQKIDSDIDILIEFKTGMKNFDNFINLSIFLEDLFNSEIDLITPDSLSKSFLNRIKNEIEYVLINT